MKKIKLLLIIIILGLNTGCWNYRELNDISIVTALGIDKGGDNFLISIQVLNPKMANGSGDGGGMQESSVVTYYNSEGKSIFEGLNNISLEIPKEVDVANIDVVIISEEVARDGLEKFIDFLLRDREVRKIFPILVAKDARAIDILKIITPLETIPGLNIRKTLENMARQHGQLTNRTFDEVLDCLYVEGREPSMSSIEIIGNIEEGELQENITSPLPKTTLRLNGASILLKDKLVGFLSDDESKGFDLIRNTFQKGVFSFPCDNQGNHGTIIINSINTKIDTKLIKKKPATTVNTKISSSLMELNCHIDPYKLKNIEKIEKMASDEIKNIMNQTVIRLQTDLKSDVLGFGEMLYRNHYKDWLKYKDDWNTVFTTMDYEIKLNLNIETIGSIITHSKKD